MFSNLAYLDIFVLAIYLGLVAIISFMVGRREKSSDDFFLGGRKMPWWNVCLSVLATEISAVTFIGQPEIGFSENFKFVQFAFGSLLGRFLIAYVLLPGFFSQKIDTIYGYFENRYGVYTRKMASIFFMLTRIMASGVRLYAASVALDVVSGLGFKQSVCIVTFVACSYTLLGGLKAVMWTDMLQIALFFGGAVLALSFILMKIDGGFNGVLQYLSEYKQTTGVDKLQVFDFSFDWSNAKTFWVSLVFGCFMTFASMGADQDLAQRLLSCEKLKESQRAIVLSGFVVFPVVFLFLFLGSSLFVFSQIHPELFSPDSGTKVFPLFIKTILPPGFRGLLIAAVLAAAMSSLDSALNALSSSMVLDLWPRNKLREIKDEWFLFRSRLATALFAIILLVFAILCEGRDNIVFWAFKLVSFTYGPLLGIFILGLLTKRGSDRGNLFTMPMACLLTIIMHFTQDYFVSINYITKPLIAWSWYLPFGLLCCLIMGYCFKNIDTARKSN